jgi:hypothetical protein
MFGMKQIISKLQYIRQPFFNPHPPPSLTHPSLPHSLLPPPSPPHPSPPHPSPPLPSPPLVSNAHTYAFCQAGGPFQDANAFTVVDFRAEGWEWGRQEQNRGISIPHTPPPTPLPPKTLLLSKNPFSTQILQC